MLVVDIGNSRIKWCVWHENDPHHAGKRFYSKQSIDDQLDACFKAVPEQSNVIICSVADHSVNKAVNDWFAEHWGREPVFVKSHSRQHNVTNGYRQPGTLGVDRWVAMVAAYEKYQKAVCVIDCGTAITLDIVLSNGVHQGGLIMPGIQLMRQALFKDTAAIVEQSGVVKALADNTADAVQSGSVQLVAAGLCDLYRRYSAQYDDQMVCVLTGGDGKEIARYMECDCRYDVDLILYGLRVLADS